jgi:hypothetical protein
MAAPTKSRSNQNADAQTKLERNLVSGYVDDWRRLQNQKARQFGGVEARVLTSLAMYYGEHFVQQQGFSIVGRPMTDDDKNKLWLVFNMLARAVDRKIGRLWSIDHQFRATPNTLNPVAWDQADIVTKLIKALNRKVKEGSQQWDRLWWLLLGGVVIEHTPWSLEVAEEALPEYDEATGEMIWIDHWNNDQPVSYTMVQDAVSKGAPPERFEPKETVKLVGEVGSEIVSPLNFFIDASVTRVRKLEADQACYVAWVKSKGWIEDNFGSEKAAQVAGSGDLNIVKTTLMQNNAPVVANMNLQDLIPAIQGSRKVGDPEMAIVLTRYLPRSTKNPKGKRCIFTPEGVLLDETDIAEYEGIPCTDIHWRPSATSFWSQDFLTNMIPAQKFLNKRMSQLGESANAQVYEMILLGAGLKREKIPTDYHGVVEDAIDEQGNPQVQVMQRGNLPGFFNESIKIVVEFIETLGSSDLLGQRKFPGQIRGPLAIPMLQELLDSEDGPFYTHLGEQLAEIHQQRVNRVKVFYEPIRTLHYVGNNNKNETLVFHTSNVLRQGWDYNIDIEPSSLLPEISSMREARVMERLQAMPMLYMNRRTGKIDVSKIASDLKYNDTEREDRESQYRKLARQFIGALWQGKQLDPNLPMPFYDHDVMMDEFESSMCTTEWLEASQEVKQGFVDFYNKCQAFLQKLHDQQQSVMDNKMLQNAVAMATQQAAAKAAATATDAALSQVDSQEQANQQNPVIDQVQQMARPRAGTQRRM